MIMPLILSVSMLTHVLFFVFTFFLSFYLMSYNFFLFFFVKQKTAYDMRISDWSFRRVLFRSLGARLLPVAGRLSAGGQRRARDHRRARDRLVHPAPRIDPAHPEQPRAADRFLFDPAEVRRPDAGLYGERQRGDRAEIGSA